MIEHNPMDYELVRRAKARPPDWSGDVIKAWDENSFDHARDFIRRNYWCDNGSINIFRIIGTKHWDYQGKSWLEFLTGGKRMHINLPLHEQKPEYYDDVSHKLPTMSYVTLNGIDFYVDSDGNHRSVIARFDFHNRGKAILHGVRLAHYEIDHDLHKLYRDFHTQKHDGNPHFVPLSIKVVRQPIKREDDAGWKIDEYKISLSIQISGEQQKDLDIHKAEELYSQLLQKPLTKEKRSIFSLFSKNQ